MRKRHSLLLLLLTAPLVPTAYAQPTDSIPDIDPANLPPGIVAPREITPHTFLPADYPDVSLRLQETGTTSLRFVVLEDGSIGMIQVLQPSGFQRLDDASIAMIQSRWRYAPAMRNGQPIRVWQHAKVVWQLEPDPLPPPRVR